MICDEYDKYLESRSNYDDMWTKFPCIEDCPPYKFPDNQMEVDPEDNDADDDMEREKHDEQHDEQHDDQHDEQHVRNDEVELQAVGNEAGSNDGGAREEDGIMWICEPPTLSEEERSKYPKYVDFLECKQYANLPQEVPETTFRLSHWPTDRYPGPCEVWLQSGIKFFFIDVVVAEVEFTENYKKKYIRVWGCAPERQFISLWSGWPSACASVEPLSHIEATTAFQAYQNQLSGRLTGVCASSIGIAVRSEVTPERMAFASRNMIDTLQVANNVTYSDTFGFER